MTKKQQLILEYEANALTILFAHFCFIIIEIEFENFISKFNDKT